MNDILTEYAENLRANMERHCAEEDGDMADFFVGGIYGEDGEGNWIVGYGVCGSANLVVCPDHAECGGRRSTEFSAEMKSALASLRSMMENC